MPTALSTYGTSACGAAIQAGVCARLLADHHIRTNMSRVGNPHGNAKAERFMRLKEVANDFTQHWAIARRPNMKNSISA